MSSDNQTRRTGRVMIFAMWILVLLGLTFFFNEWLSEQNNPNRRIAASIQDDGNIEVVLQRNRAGHFVTTGHINDHPVVFLVDTGATDVNIPGHIAKQLQLPVGQPHSATTANGVITVFGTRLKTVGIDKLTLQDIRASINPHMHNDEILLGMSFLRHLELNQRGDTLRLSILR